MSKLIQRYIGMPIGMMVVGGFLFIPVTIIVGLIAWGLSLLGVPIDIHATTPIWLNVLSYTFSIGLIGSLSYYHMMGQRDRVISVLIDIDPSQRAYWPRP